MGNILKIVVSGSRAFNNKALLTEIMYGYQTEPSYGELEIISGGAKGADTLARQYAEKLNLKFTEFPADWEKHGKSAGVIRNKQMAEYGDILIAFWDGESRGTKNMIDQMNKLNKIVKIIMFH